MLHKEIICIIPARKGSKGIKNKNIKKINGKELIQYSIDTAKKLNNLVDICVSTNSIRVKAIVRKNKINFFGLRPERLSTDYIETYDVVKYELKKYEYILKKNYKYILLLQPTSPIRDTKKILKAINLLKKNNNIDSVISVKDVGANHPLRMKIFKKNFLVNYSEKKKENMLPRQKLPKVYIRSGSIYLTTRKSFFKNKSLVGKKCKGVILKDLETTNIDNIDDLNNLKKTLKK